MCENPSEYRCISANKALNGAIDYARSLLRFTIAYANEIYLFTLRNVYTWTHVFYEKENIEQTFAMKKKTQKKIIN